MVETGSHGKKIGMAIVAKIKDENGTVVGRDETEVAAETSSDIGTVLETLIAINSTMEAPVTDITIQGIGFRDAKATYLAPHGVPSGGDWALQRVSE